MGKYAATYSGAGEEEEGGDLWNNKNFYFSLRYKEFLE